MKALMLLLALAAGLGAAEGGPAAAKDLEGVPPLDPQAQALWQQGSDSMEAGRPEEAVAAFEAALKASPSFHDALFSLGLARRKAGQFQQAVANFQELIRIQPQMMEGWYQMGLCFAALGQYGKAADAYRMALSYNEDCGVCRCALALASRERGRKEENFREAGACVKLLPEYGGGWNLLGIAQMDKGDFDGAAGSFRRAVELSPAYANAWHNFGSALRGINQMERAEEAYLRAAGLKPDADNFCALGEARLRLGKLPEAGQAFAKALELKPGSPEAHWGLARYYRKKGNSKKAEREERLYRRAVGQAEGDGDYVAEPAEELRKADLQAMMDAWEDSHAGKSPQP